MFLFFLMFFDVLECLECLEFFDVVGFVWNFWNFLVVYCLNLCVLFFFFLLVRLFSEAGTPANV